MSGTDAGSIKLVAGRLCLDFVNAVGGRNSSPAEKGSRKDYGEIRADKLIDYSDLVRWSEHVGILTAAEARNLLGEAEGRAEEARAVLARALDLREAIYRIFKSLLAGWKVDAAEIDTVNRELTIAQSHDHLVYSGGSFRWGWEGNREALDYMLWVITQSVAELLTSDELSRVRQCGGESCGWLFFDTSRNRSRQWCDMQDCGNVAKVRRFRTRQKEGA
jgi:predicted RNA-binding Zn ribbon-like protein